MNDDDKSAVIIEKAPIAVLPDCKLYCVQVEIQSSIISAYMLICVLDGEVRMSCIAARHTRHELFPFLI